MAKTEKKKIGLTTRIFISLLLGAILGVFLHYCVLPMTPYRIFWSTACSMWSDRASCV